MGIQNLIFRVLGTIPAPIVFGALIDKACIFFATSCGDELGNCSEYDSTEMRNYFIILAIVPKFCSFCMFFLSWYYFRGSEDVDGSSSRPLVMDRELSGRIEMGEHKALVRANSEDEEALQEEDEEEDE